MVNRMATHSGREHPRRFGFLLLRDFTLISLSSAVEPLRMANRIRGDSLYSWTIITETGEAMSASDGLSINSDHSIKEDRLFDGLDVIIVCTGRRVESAYTKPVERWLKMANQKGVALGAVCTGSYVLARAGLLDGYRCSIHWENLAALEDSHRNIAVSRNVFTIDRNRYTSSGGTTPVDMMLHIIREECGPEVTAGVAEQYIYERVRRADDKQRIPLKHLLGNASSKLVMAVELMEANIKEPISQEELAVYVGLSRRQLQRLFQRHLSCAPSRYYLQLRLQRARELLQQTDLSLIEISSLCGFVSTSHFSQCYKEHFGHSPSVERQKKVPKVIAE
jgi:transcriptional regulator GlxA family with amidase domain